MPIHTVGGPNSSTIADNVGKIAITPDGKTAYATTGSDVTPISTATNTPGKPIHIAPGAGGPGYPDFIAITPDGKTAYVASGPGTVKTLGARARDRLRAVLGDALADPGPARQPPGDLHQAKGTWHE